MCSLWWSFPHLEKQPIQSELCRRSSEWRSHLLVPSAEKIAERKNCQENVDKRRWDWCSCSGCCKTTRSNNSKIDMFKMLTAPCNCNLSFCFNWKWCWQDGYITSYWLVEAKLRIPPKHKSANRDTISGWTTKWNEMACLNLVETSNWLLSHKTENGSYVMIW